MRDHESRRGAVLLEAMVGLLILSGLAAAAMGFSAEHTRQVAMWEQREREMRAADRLMGVLAHLERGELEQRVGQWRAGQMQVLVQRPRRSVFRVSVLSETGDQEILVTLLHRPGNP